MSSRTVRMGDKDVTFEGHRPKCPECGSKDIRFSPDTILGVQQIVFVIQEDGTIGVRCDDGWDAPLEPILANGYDANFHEIAYCGGCSLEDEGYYFVEEAN